MAKQALPISLSSLAGDPTPTRSPKAKKCRIAEGAESPLGG